MWARWSIWFLIVLVTIPSTSHAHLKILQIMCNPAGSDADYEWIKLKNTATTTINTGEYVLIDSGKQLNITPTTNINPDEIFYVARNASKLNFSEPTLQASISLHNKQDTIAIKHTGSGEIVDSVSYSKSSGFDSDELCFDALGGSGNSSTNTSSDNQQGSSVNVDDYKVVFKTVTISPAPRLFVKGEFATTTSVGALTNFAFYAYDSKGDVVPAKFYTNTGDSKSYQLPEFAHVYRYPGEYMVHTRANYQKLIAQADTKIYVYNPELEFIATNELFQIRNNSEAITNLSGYKICLSGRCYRLPEGTWIAPASVLSLSWAGIGFKRPNHIDKIRVKNALNALVANVGLSYKPFAKGAVQENSSTSTSSVALVSATSTPAPNAEKSNSKNSLTSSQTQYQNTHYSNSNSTYTPPTPKKRIAASSAQVPKNNQTTIRQNKQPKSTSTLTTNNLANAKSSIAAKWEKQLWELWWLIPIGISLLALGVLWAIAFRQGDKFKITEL